MTEVAEEVALPPETIPSLFAPLPGVDGTNRRDVDGVAGDLGQKNVGVAGKAIASGHVRNMKRVT